MSRARGKPVRDPTGLICFFYNKMDSVLKMSLSIEYQTKSDPPLVPSPTHTAPKYASANNAPKTVSNVQILKTDLEPYNINMHKNVLLLQTVNNFSK